MGTIAFPGAHPIWRNDGDRRGPDGLFCHPRVQLSLGSCGAIGALGRCSNGQLPIFHNPAHSHTLDNGFLIGATWPPSGSVVGYLLTLACIAYQHRPSGARRLIPSDGAARGHMVGHYCPSESEAAQLTLSILSLDTFLLLSNCSCSLQVRPSDASPSLWCARLSFVLLSDPWSHRP
jgi:hypothetical protein